MPISKAEMMRRLRAQRRDERLVQAMPRSCSVCGAPIPLTARADAAACSNVCRARASRARADVLRLSDAECAALVARAWTWAGKQTQTLRLVVEGVQLAVTTFPDRVQFIGRGIFASCSPTVPYRSRLPPALERLVFDEVTVQCGAKLGGGSPDAVRLARRVQEASPELHERVKRGELHLGEATRMAGIVPTPAERRALSRL